ncbi:branched-chain amino acid ABC transporter permease [Afifella sp. IM 167]|uniref:branched-chain amino acid ABC transporter permease n=1 Tax=Afifella sp. IM 167 TaxID=2033586 RepID=UPI001CCC398F|nr:branched-chain amino acid ABC transporter permease [Afifella sp. IM 167]MBZ8134482.1 branched-chain amino acid ABC transporter permease [Afifella sp. IM 167]
MKAKHQLAAAAVLLVLALILPAVIDNYWLRVMTTVFMIAIVAQGLNVIVGFAGYHAFGNAAFFGVGAYIAGVSLNAQVPLALAIVLATGGSAVVAGIFGWPLLRLRGHYFAIASVALNMAFVEVILNLGGVTGGAMGLPLPISPMPPDLLYRMIYYMMLGALTVATLVVWHLSGSRLGYALRALRDSESGAEVMGVDTVKAKILAWMISAAMTGCAGGIWAYWLTFIEVGSAFDIGISMRAYIMMLLGGMGTIIGPVVGAFVFEIVATLVWSEFTHIHNLLLGMFLIAVVILVPNGIIHLISRASARLSAARELRRAKA